MFDYFSIINAIFFGERGSILNPDFKKYESILYMDAPVSKKHMPMSTEQRAAQFAPFDALSGIEEVAAAAKSDADARHTGELEREEITDA